MGLRAYNKTQITINLGKLGFNNFSFPIVVYSLSKNNTITFNQIHNEKECIDKNAGVNYVKRCSYCKKELSNTEIAKTFRLSEEEKAVFSEEELKAIKSRTDILEVIEVSKNAEIKEWFKGKCFGITINSKSKTSDKDKQALNTLISFLGEELCLIG